MDVHRFLRRGEDAFFLSGGDVLFQNVEKHIGVLHVRDAVRDEVRHLLRAKAQVARPDPRELRAISAADVSQQTIVVGPLGDRRGRDRLLPRAVAREPPPALNRRLGRRQRLGAVELLLAHADLTRLAHDEIDVADGGVLVFHQLFVFMREDSLLHFQLGTIRGDLRPIISPLPNVDANWER